MPGFDAGTIDFVNGRQLTGPNADGELPGERGAHACNTSEASLALNPPHRVCMHGSPNGVHLPERPAA